MSYFTEKVEYRLSRPHTQHPSIYFTIPKSFLSSTSTSTSDSCSPYLLLALPPSIFLDPFSFPPHSSTIPQGIQSIHLLGPTELEKAVGWSTTSSSSNQDSHHLQTERTAVLAKLSTIQQRENGKSRSDGIRELEIRTPWDAELQDRKQVEEIEMLGIPLHARYLPPKSFAEVDDENSSLSSNSTLLEKVQFHTQHLLKPIKPLLNGLTRSAFKDGNYHRVQLDVPSFFWACQNDGKAWDMLDEVQKVASVGWDLTGEFRVLEMDGWKGTRSSTNISQQDRHEKCSLNERIEFEFPESFHIGRFGDNDRQRSARKVRIALLRFELARP